MVDSVAGNREPSAPVALVGFPSHEIVHFPSMVLVTRSSSHSTISTFVPSLPLPASNSKRARAWGVDTEGDSTCRELGIRGEVCSAGTTREEGVKVGMVCDVDVEQEKIDEMGVCGCVPAMRSAVLELLTGDDARVTEGALLWKCWMCGCSADKS